MPSKRSITSLLLMQYLLINVMRANGVVATIAPEDGTNENGLTDVVIDQLGPDNEQLNKRSWQSLQGSWGKRFSGPAADNDDTDDSVSGAALYVTGHFVPLLITDGENTLDWRTFQHLASKPETEVESGEQVSDPNNQLISNEKRTWKHLNQAWGKRRQAQNWNKFRGAWGKREAQWNNLKGMWGKRDQWQKLHGGWGKRVIAN